MINNSNTTIKTALMQYYLMRGTILAALGALILVISGSSFPLTILNKWGFFFFAGALLLITCGLLPYSRLRRLELNPHKLSVEDDCVYLFRKEKLLIRIPKENIAEVRYVEKEYNYGILLILKTPLSKRMKWLNRIGFFPHCQVTKEGNLFLRYFNERVYTLLNTTLNDIVHLD